MFLPSYLRIIYLSIEIPIHSHYIVSETSQLAGQTKLKTVYHQPGRLDR